MQTQRIIFGGRVQGVGFRPYIYKIAKSYNLTGYVRNLSGAVEVVIQGPQESIKNFVHSILNNIQSHSKPGLNNKEIIDSQLFNEFRIIESESTKENNIYITPDLSPCSECISELVKKDNHRYLYPFINCTSCGPRYSIVSEMPYDRCHTSMCKFNMCDFCENEYSDENNRRFHAQPVACEKCGPELFLSGPNESQLIKHEALTKCIEYLKEGKIIAIKGVGGYHLVCDASNQESIQLLRSRKNRPHKPFAVMLPWKWTQEYGILKRHFKISPDELTSLMGMDRPIVLLEQANEYDLAENINPGLSKVGVLLPTSPLHYLLLELYGSPVVATSANISGNSLIYTKYDAENELQNIADVFLHHTREIVRPIDDSVVHFIGNKKQTIRIGRGIAPLEMELPCELIWPTLAVGGHMKNTIAMAWENRIVISQYIGDLSSPSCMDNFEKRIFDIQNLYQINVERIVCDAHPDYGSTRWAQQYAAQRDLNVYNVCHHHAHASVISGQYPNEKVWLVFTWDGTGLGEDGALWGGEALLGNSGCWQRVASFKPFSLIGGDKSSTQPWRSAAALMWQHNLNWTPTTLQITHDELDFARSAWSCGRHAVTSSSAGRIFDAAASLIMNMNVCSYDGQAPMVLEAAAGDLNPDSAISLPLINSNNILEADWSVLLPMLNNKMLEQDRRSAIFHASMAMTAVEQAIALRNKVGDFAVGLSGGVFQNKKLTDFVLNQLDKNGFRVYLSSSIPVNDAGLSYGQIIEYAYRSKHD